MCAAVEWPISARSFMGHETTMRCGQWRPRPVPSSTNFFLHRPLPFPPQIDFLRASAERFHSISPPSLRFKTQAPIPFPKIQDTRDPPPCPSAPPTPPSRPLVTGSSAAAAAVAVKRDVSLVPVRNLIPAISLLDD